MTVATSRLTSDLLASGARALARRDAALAAVVARYGIPPMWGRRAGFATLVQIVLEQQVSLASGRAAFARLVALAGEATPERIAALSEVRLRTAGLTRQKAAYIRELALATLDGRFDPLRLARLDDDDAREALLALHGIGRWTADIYLLMALRRADVWPSGDLAIAIAAREVKGLRRVPTADELDRLAEPWRPWRAVAARILWHHYLNSPRRRVTGP